MKLHRSKVKAQVQRMMDKLVREEHIEVLSTSRTTLENRIARIVTRYIEEYEELEDKAYRFLGENDMDVDPYFKRVLHNLAKQDEVLLGSDALDQLNADIEALLWDDEGVVELYVEDRELVALVNPFLKAMA